MPEVSVVIPLYQTERFIAEALKSVLSQTFTDYEVIVVDDGSSDRGPEIARSFGDPRVRVFTQLNRGLAGARNTGIREANGTFIALLDADDLWHPEKLAVHVDVLRRSPHVGVCFAASRFIDDDGQPIGLIQKPVGERFKAGDIFCRNPVGNGSAPVIRRAVLDQIAFHDAALGRDCWFDESFRQSEDIECWTRIAATTTWEFELIPGVYTDYRVSAGGLSANTVKQFETWQRFRAKVAQYAPDLVRGYGARAEAYQLRYLARRAIAASAAGSDAARMMMRALSLYPRMVIEEPVRTVVTTAAAVVLMLVPGALFERVAGLVRGQAGRVPGLRV